MLKEFRDFIMRGNVIDLAVAVIMAGAFGAIINSIVNDIIMPIVGVIIGGLDFSGTCIHVRHRRHCLWQMSPGNCHLCDHRPCTVPDRARVLTAS